MKPVCPNCKQPMRFMVEQNYVDPEKDVAYFKCETCSKIQYEFDTETVLIEDLFDILGD